MDSGAIFQKSVWRSILSLSIPSLISIAVMMLYNMADMYFVGWMGDVSQMASVSLAGPVFSILMAISTMVGNGSCTKIAQALGREDLEQVRRCTALCIWGSLALGILFALACVLFHNPLLTFLGANDEMWDYTRAYILILALGAPIILLNHSLSGALRGEGAVNAGMVSGMISTAANLLLDPVFILLLKLGVGGAAIATVLGNAVSVIYILIYRMRKKNAFTLELHPRYARNIKLLGGILALGLPNAISNALAGLAGSFSNRLLVGYGTGAVAAMAASGKAIMIVTMVQMGICMGIQPLLAYCYGGQDWPRLKEVIRKILILTFSLGSLLTLGIWLGRKWLIALFIQDAGVVLLGQKLVSYTIWLGPFVGIYYLSTNFLQAGGNAPGAAASSALRQGILLIPLLHMMNHLFQLKGLALAHLAADGLSILITGWMALRYFHKITKTA